MSKTLGHVKHMKISNTGPGMLEQFKNLDMDFNSLIILVGHNGSGKSLILKLTWALSTILNNIIISDVHKIPVRDDIKMAKFILDNTFTNQDITGDIHFEFECGSTLLIKMLKGDIIDCISTYNSNLQPTGQPQFMSTNIRLFTNIVAYLKFKKALGISNDMSKFTEDELKKLCDMYRIYDIIYMELLFRKIDSGIISQPSLKLGELPKLNEMINKFDGFNLEIADITMDYANSDIMYKDASNNVKSLTSLGNGHQSIINMFLGNL